MSRRAGISGTGLIGASIGLGLRQSGWTVSGFDPDEGRMAVAVEKGAVSDSRSSLEELVAEEPDLLVLAAPTFAVLAELERKSHAGLTIDVCGVKEAVVAAAGEWPRFVGTHPMAGREISGPAAASAGLFQGAAWVVVTDGARDGDLDAVAEIVGTLGARSVRMTAAEHDAAVAAVSHVPHLLAGALVEMVVNDEKAGRLASGSFRDLTRVAASDPGPWVDVLLANKAEVLARLGDLDRRLSDVAAAIAADERDQLADLLETAREHRRGLAPSIVPVRVALADRPGELARVGHALEASAVDIRDLQLRHAPHGGGGVLTLSVRPGEAEALRDALTTEGLILVE
jgi:prephenate dehydrogenase